MTTVLFRKDDLEFCVSDTFEGKFLLSLLENMKEKMRSETWDDYNEVHHCCKIIHEFSRTPGLVMDFHTLRRGEEQLGIAEGLVIKPIKRTFPIRQKPFFLISAICTKVVSQSTVVV